MFRQIRETTLLWKLTKGFGWIIFTSWTCSNSMYELKRVKAVLKGIKKKDQTIKNGAEKVGNIFKKGELNLVLVNKTDNKKKRQDTEHTKQTTRSSEKETRFDPQNCKTNRNQRNEHKIKWFCMPILSGIPNLIVIAEKKLERMLLRDFQAPLQTT